MARYDFGFRGEWDTTHPWWATHRPGWYDRDLRRPDRRRRPHHVTAQYNIDYVRDRGSRYPINPFRYAGAWRGQIIGEEEYGYPYMTRGGTRTHRGSYQPPSFGYRDFGPSYGGRYPDEL